MQLTCPHCQQVLHFSGRRPAFCAYCGRSLPPPAEVSTTAENAPPPDDDADPAEVGGYRLLRRLGEGGMGRVYEAEGPGGRRVAVKLISAEFAGSPAAVERFRREGRLASAVSHPRCVFVLAADEAGGRPYIVMELMPGATLQDVVDREGPLPVDKAIIYILDVIEGLREAHRHGVVHRDVKPSNCFLDADRRVKVGDFGLAKSLVGADALTRTGTFIGTPLFASPEQIKGEAVGPHSDVYSVAATLYCLLTGRAPFQGADPAATLARIVSDPAPPMRSLRAGLPEALDRAVLRGLERDPARRWRDLDEFRAALLPFVPGQLSIGGLGARFGAFVIDYALMAVAGLPLFFLTVVVTGGGNPWDPNVHTDRMAAQLLAGLLLWALYFGGCEAAWGCTPGKRWLGLRVCRTVGGERPGVGAAAVRTGLFFVLLSVGTLALQALLLCGVVDAADARPERQIAFALMSLAFYPLESLGILAMAATMRARNGYRGLHEVLSGTRVVRLPDAVRRRTRTFHHVDPDLAPPDGLPARIGPFEVAGVLPGAGRVAVAVDPTLGRRVWVWLRPAGEPPLSAARRDLNRTTRLRWLSGGRDGELQWDAFLAPDGGPLPAAAAAEPLTWAEARPLLAQLADELAQAEADGTLPASLSPQQVWLRSDGRPQLLDAPAGAVEGSTKGDPLSLLARTAVLALEGKPRPARRRPAGVRAPLPRHAAEILGRLVGAGQPYADVREFRAALAAVQDRPAETTRPRRLAHAAVLATFLSFGLCGGLGSTAIFPLGHAGSMALQTRRQEAVRQSLAEVAAQDAADLDAADPIKRRQAAANHREDERLAAALDRTLEQQRLERAARLDALNGLGRAMALAIEDQSVRTMESLEKQPGHEFLRPPPASNPVLVRVSAQTEIASAPPKDETPEAEAWVQTYLLLFWPAVWVVWAFLFRGGFTYPMTGLALVRGDGRPAWRVQCAWRAFLVWAPLAGLAVASVWLDAAYWSAWPGANPWLLRASAAAWWAALALLPLYAALAVWFPRRCLHDRLAGTYVVPW